MPKKPSYEELEQRVKELEAEVLNNKGKSPCILNAIFEYTSDALYAKDLEGRYLHMNSIGAQIIGRPVDEIIGRDDSALFLPDEAERMTQNDRRIMSTGESIAVEETLTKNGATRTYLSTKSPYRDKDGNVIGIIGVSRDITDRKLSEEALKQSEERFSQFMSNFPGVAFMKDSDLRFVYFNKRYKDLFGEDRLGKKPEETWPPEIAEKLRKNDTLVFEKGTPIEFEEEVPQNGEHHKYLTVKFPIEQTGRPPLLGGIGIDITERKRIVKELELRGEVIRNMAEGVCLVRVSDGTFVYANPKFEEMFGYVSGELIGKNVSVVNAHTDKAPVETANEIIESLNEKGIWEGEVLNIRKDGMTFWCRAKVSTFEHPEYGKVWVAIHNDITERKRIEAALKESEERYRTVFEESPIGIGIASFDGNLYGVNRAAKDMFGFPDDFSGINMAEFYYDTDERAKLVNEIKVSGKVSDREIKLKRTDGTYFWGLVNFDVIFLDSQKRMIASVRDISDRKRAESALHESEEKYRTLFNAAPIGIGISDFDGKIYALNQVAKNSFGLPDDYRNINMSQFYYDHNERARLVEELKASGKVSGMEVRFKRIDGTFFWVLLNVEVITLDGQKRLFATSSDITKHKLMEGELIKAQRIESVGILAGGIAHDFNNLLTIIGSRISLAKLTRNPDALSESLTAAENACKRAADITKRLLTFSKGGAPVTKTVSISGLVKESVDFASRGSNVKVKATLPNDIWAVDVDEGQLSQVINNLIINAQQAMPDGGIVDIAAENIVVDESDLSEPLPPGKYLRITVRDKGTGIPAKDMGKIFDPYFTTKPKGSGLGLATSYSIIKNHKGYIFAESEVGVGTAFHIYLLASQHETQDNAAEHGQLVEGKGNILLMDDDEMLRDSTSEIICSLGYKVETARDGGEAIELYKKAREEGNGFDIVILDLTVPGAMGGREAIKRLLEIDPNVNAVVSSGYSDDASMADFKKHGFKGVLAKPYDMEKMSETLGVMMADRFK